MSLNANALTTLNTAKTYCSVPLATITEDGRFELWINSASARIEKYCDRKLAARTGLVEFHHGRRQNVILLKEWPAFAVSEVAVDNQRVFAPASVLDPSIYAIGDDGTTILLSQHLANGLGNVRVTYSAGFQPGDSELSDLEQACLWTVEWYYRHRTRADIGRSSGSKGDENWGVLTDFPPMIKTILDDYRRTEVPGAESPIGNY